MRLDKYLKVSRLIKRRTVANEACDNGLVTVNGKPARASYEVKEGDQITLRFGVRTVTVEVLSVPGDRAAERCRPPCTGRSNKFFYLPPCPHTLRAGRDLMTNDFNMPVTPHRLELMDRAHLTVSGVEDVERFDESGVIMTTSAGTLIVTGEDLHIGKLSLEGGELYVDGRITSISYEDTPNRQGGFFSRLFG